MNTHTCLCSCMNTPMCTPMLAHACIHMHEHMCTCMDTHIYTPTQKCHRVLLKTSSGACLYLDGLPVFSPAHTSVPISSRVYSPHTDLGSATGKILSYTLDLICFLSVIPHVARIKDVELCRAHVHKARPTSGLLQKREVRFALQFAKPSFSFFSAPCFFP